MANKKIEDINAFESLLKEYYEEKNNLREFADVKFSFDEHRKIKDKMNLALKHLKIRQMTGKMNYSAMTFSQVLYNFRSKNKLSKPDIKNILGIQISQIDDLESGKKQIDSIDVKIIANILSRLRITISQYSQLLINEIKAKTFKKDSLQAFARSKSTMSPDDRSKKMQHGIDSVMLEISKRKKNQQEIEVDEKHIENIKKHLVKLGEMDLLV